MLPSTDTASWSATGDSPSGEHIDLAELAERRDQLAAGGHTVVITAVDDKAAGLISIADAPAIPRPPPSPTLHDAGVQVVNAHRRQRRHRRAYRRPAGIDTVIAEVLPGDKAAKVAECKPRADEWPWSATASTTPPRSPGRPRHRHRAGTDVAIETAT